MNNNQLSRKSIALHWVVAIGMISLLAVGWYMESIEVYGLYDIHKSSGILLLAVILFRVVWRLKQGFPEPLGESKKSELFLAKLTHWGLLIATLAFPISGMMMSGAGGHGLDIFGLVLLPENVDAVSGRAVAHSKEVASLGHQAHGILMWVVLGLLALHVAGALKHHFVYKDKTLTRMLGKS